MDGIASCGHVRRGMGCVVREIWARARRNIHELHEKQRQGGVSASKKLLAAIAVLAVAFAVFAAIPAVADDSDAGAATDSSNTLKYEIFEEGGATYISGPTAANAAGKVAISTTDEVNLISSSQADGKKVVIDMKSGEIKKTFRRKFKTGKTT